MAMQPHCPALPTDKILLIHVYVTVSNIFLNVHLSLLKYFYFDIIIDSHTILRSNIERSFVPFALIFLNLVKL